MKKILALIISIIALGSSISFASTFTPVRPPITFPESGVAGLSYNSFNNYTGNTNISNAPINGDERQFLTAMKCLEKTPEELAEKNKAHCTPEKASNGEEILFADGWENVQDGNMYEFEIYFHNNAEDPYDGAQEGPEIDAKDIKIGIDFSNSSTPIGFISADNVEYFSSTGTQLKYESSDYRFDTATELIGGNVKTVSDNVTFSSNDEFYFEPIQEETYLYMAYKHDGKNLSEYYNSFIKPSETETVNVKVKTLEENGEPSGSFQNFPIKVTSAFDPSTNKIFAHFDRMPGCLRYSGNLWFKAIVHKAPTSYCSSLNLTKSGEPICTDTIKSTFFTLDTLFTRTEPNPQYIKFTSTDPDSTITIGNETQTTYENRPIYGTNGVILSFTSPTVLSGLYNGLGTLTAEYVDANGTPIPGKRLDLTGKIITSDCKAQLQSCTNSCGNICVTGPTSFHEETYSELSAKTVDYTGSAWDDQITYTVEEGHGAFYKKQDYNGDKSITIDDLIYKIKQDYPNSNPVKNTTNTSLCVSQDQLGITTVDVDGPFLLQNITDIFTNKLIRDKSNPVSEFGQNNVFASFTPTIKGISEEVLPDAIPTERIFPGTIVPPTTFSTRTTITVNQGEKVWFYAIEKGTNVITVSSANDPSKCIKSFSIYSFPENICKNINVTASSKGVSYTNPTSLNGREIYTMQSKSEFTLATPNTTQINYNAGMSATTVPYGYFAKSTTVNIAGLDITVPDLDLTAWSPYLNTLESEEVFFFANPKLAPGTYNDVVRISVVGTTVPGCLRLIDLIIPEQNICESIILKTNPTPFDPTTKTQITIDPNSAFGNYDGRFKFEITEGAEYADFYISETSTVKAKEFTLEKNVAISSGVYILATQTGRVTVTVTAEDVTQEGCKAILSTEDICKTITLHTDTNNHFNPIETEEILITGDFGAYNGNFTFTVTKGSAKIYSLDTPEDKKSTITVSIDEAKSGIGFYGTIDEDTIIEVIATDENPTQCKSKMEYGKTEDNVCKELVIEKPDTPWTIDEDQDDQKFRVYVDPPNPSIPWIIHWKVEEGDTTTRFEDRITTSLTNTLKNVEQGDDITVKIYVEGYENTNYCMKTIETEETDETPPRFSKKVSEEELEENPEDNDWKDSINVKNHDTISYRIDFKNGSNNEVESVAIWDENLNDGEIDPTNKKLELMNGGSLPAGTLELEELIITIDNHEVEEEDICGTDEYEEDNNGDPCVTIENESPDDIEDIENAFKDFKDGDDSKLIFKNLEDKTRIRIYYEMKVNSNINAETCKNLDASSGCGEKFINKAQYEAFTNNRGEGNEKYDDDDSTTLIVTCPYIITRTGGDAYFGGDLEAGADISYCGPQKNISGPIIKETKTVERITSSGPNPEAVLSSPTHDVCKFSNTKDNLSGYQNALTSFSSSICEMETEVSEKWDFNLVKTQIISNAERVGRFAETGGDTFKANITEEDPSIYRFDNGATVSTSGTTITGAHTYIINGDFNINGNIEYGDSVDYTDVNNVPSAAFIVIDGNINVGKNVTQMDGIYIVISDQEDNTGKFIATGGESNQQLTINGGLYGNVSDLFTNRTYVGNVENDAGSITIRYSENFIINTPPGLNDLMSISQLKAP